MKKKNTKLKKCRSSFTLKKLKKAKKKLDEAHAEFVSLANSTIGPWGTFDCRVNINDMLDPML